MIRSLRAIAALVSFELRRWEHVILLSLPLGLVPLVLPLLPGASRFGGDGRPIVALVLTAGLAGLVFLPLLTTTWTRGLWNDGLAFSYSQPISGTAIWASRLLGSLLGAAGSFVLVTGPTIIASGPVALLADWRPEILAIAGVALPVPALLNAFGLHVRRPGYFSAAFLVLAGSLAAGAWLAISLVFGMGGLGAPWLRIAPFGVLALSGALLLASWAQMRSGRTDARRSQRAHSIAFIGSISAFALMTWLVGPWRLLATPSGLLKDHLVWVEDSEAPWTAVSGLDEKYELFVSFLVNRTTGEWRLLRSGWPAHHEPPPYVLVAPANGTTLWRTVSLGEEEHSYHWHLLDPRDSGASRIDLDATQLELLGEPLAVSAQGRYIATLGWRTDEIVVATLPELEPVCSIPRPDRFLPNHLRFQGDDSLLVAYPIEYPPTGPEPEGCGRPRQLLVEELSLPTCALRTIASSRIVLTEHEPAILVLDPSRSTALVEWSASELVCRESIELLDLDPATTHAQNRLIVPGDSDCQQYESALALTGGRLLLNSHASGGDRLRLYSPEGVLVRTLNFSARDTRALAELSPGGAILVGVFPPAPREFAIEPHLLILDPATGRLRFAARAAGLGGFYTGLLSTATAVERPSGRLVWIRSEDEWLRTTLD